METKLDIHIRSLNDLPGAAKEFLDACGHRRVFAFNAEMGTGKTTFILSLLRGMGIQNPEGSPTYSLVNVYDSEMFGRIYHFDLYRIEDEHEALDIGLEEMLYSDGICLIEWPDVIEHLLPENTVLVQMRKNADESRNLTIEV